MDLSFGLQMVWVLASQEAIVAKFESIEIEHLFISLMKFAELNQNQLQMMGQMPDITSILIEEKSELLKKLENYEIKVPEISKPLRRLLRKNRGYGHYLVTGRKKIHRSKEAREIFIKAETYDKIENSRKVTTMGLLKAILHYPSPFISQAIKELGLNIKTDFSIIPDQRKKVIEEEFYSKNPLVNLICKHKKLRTNLLSGIIGQDHAIHIFIEGLYNVEIIAKADKERKRPLGVFVFAGPPGVGKTYLAELSASYLKKPFKRFDMTAYSANHQSELLTGTSPVYKGSQPGILTEFVIKNPQAILLFDEIEKAHHSTIQLFYQILDAGRLEDNFLNKEVDFRDTIIIFTTNVGKTLYDNPNKMGISAINSNYHKKTIISALLNEINPLTGKQVFPQALCSRIGQGYPVLFNHLGINELEIICENTLQITENLLKEEYKKEFSHDSLLPITLILKEGGLTDARQIKAETEKFIKNEIFKFSSLYEKDNLENTLKIIDRISIDIDRDSFNRDPAIGNLYESKEKSSVLLIAGPALYKIYSKYITEINWFKAETEEEAKDILSVEDINLVLLDLWIKKGSKICEEERAVSKKQDFIPLASKELDEGRNILQKLHRYFPQIPVYLLSIDINEINNKNPENNNYEDMTTIITTDIGYDRQWELEKEDRKSIDEELFLSCVRAGGARGLVKTNFADISGGKQWLLKRNQFATGLLEINRRIYREKQTKKLIKEHKVLSFTSIPELYEEKKVLTIKLRNFRLTSSIDSSDMGTILEDVEKPDIKFKDITGVHMAKSSLSFVIKWLQKPLYYRSLGIRPPKGILLTGPPGTGKTMLARALAGEADCAFIETSATTFITIWQGSGPQNIRNLFDRARRYAPSIIFIDEIDAIGKKRAASPGGSERAEEATLNALLTEMDGFSVNNPAPVIVLAATNIDKALDPALKRRFDRIISVDRPDRASRLSYIEKALTSRKVNKISKEVMERIAGQSAGMTVADLERIIQEAAIMAVNNGTDLTDELLNEAFEKIRMGEAKRLPDKKTLLRIARHEAGHTVIAWLKNRLPVQVTIVGRGNAGGYMETELNEEKIIYTTSDLDGEICILMGGRAAELLYYGDKDGFSTGIADDLKKASNIAYLMVTEYGMSKKFGLYNFENNSNMAILQKEAHKNAEKIVRTQMEKAYELLLENKKYLDNISIKLLEKNRLTKEELEEILKEK